MEETKMKKRNLFLMLILAAALLLTACGKSNPFVGEWKGTCDMTEQVAAYFDSDESEYESEYVEEYLEEYMESNRLNFQIVLKFEEDKVTIAAAENAKELYAAYFRDAFIVMGDAFLEEQASENNMSVEEVLGIIGMDYDTYIDTMFAEIFDDSEEGFDPMAEEWVAVFDISGTYEYDEDTIEITRDDDGLEEIAYVIDGDELTITLGDEEYNMSFECERQ